MEKQYDITVTHHVERTWTVFISRGEREPFGTGPDGGIEYYASREEALRAAQGSLGVDDFLRAAIEDVEI